MTNHVGPSSDEDEFTDEEESKDYESEIDHILFDEVSKKQEEEE